MTTLTADIDATQTLLPVDAGMVNGAALYPLWMMIGSEAVRVVGRAIETTWLVERAVAGTTAVSHSSGTALTRYYPDAPASGGGGGGAVDSVNGQTGVVVLDAADVGADVAGAAAAAAAASVSTARTITAGTGLTGGGDLTANRTLAADFGAAAGKVTQGNDARLSDARAPNGAAGGGLSGTYPNPAVVDDSHSHTAGTAPGAVPTMPTRAEVGAAGNDTGGIPFVSASDLNGGIANLDMVATATGSDYAEADRTAQAEDGNARATSTATANNGVTDVSIGATVAVDGGAFAGATAHVVGNGNAHGELNVNVDGNGTATAAPTVTVGGNGNVIANATLSVGGNGNIEGGASATVTGDGDAAIGRAATVLGSGNAWADTNATAGGIGSADGTTTATAAGGSASIGPVANATRAEVQVNGLPLYTAGSGAPGGSFVSLFYRDTTATTGGTYLWDFVTGAYVQIALALS